MKNLTIYLLLSVLTTLDLIQVTTQNTGELDTNDPDYVQLSHILLNQHKCTNVTEVNTKGGCPRTFDGILCWEESEPNKWAYAPCPLWIIGFQNKHGNAKKYCEPNGRWRLKKSILTNNSNVSYTNYTDCINDRDHTLYAHHLPRVRLIGKVGFTLSMLSLIIAIIMLFLLKRIHCARVILHMNLFASFLLFSVLQLFKELTWVSAIGFSKDIIEIPNQPGHYTINNEVSHWECRVLISLYRYAESSNHVMVFCEALYLSVIISISTFNQSSVRGYIAFGWFGPLIWIIPYITLMGFNSTGCWITDNKNISYLYVFPQLLLVLANFCMFINIIRVLAIKLRNNAHADSKRRQYMKLAKSTLILLPFFSIYYIVFSWLTLLNNKIYVQLELIKLYFEIICSSFQGLLISSIFCFFNSEVKTEVLRIIQSNMLVQTYKTRYSENSQQQRPLSLCEEHQKYQSTRRNSALVRFTKIDLNNTLNCRYDECEVFIESNYNLKSMKSHHKSNEFNLQKDYNNNLGSQCSVYKKSLIRYFQHYVKETEARPAFTTRESNLLLLKRNSSTPNLSSLKFSSDMDTDFSVVHRSDAAENSTTHRLTSQSRKFSR